MNKKLALIFSVLMILSVISMATFAEEVEKLPNASIDEKATLNDAGEVMPIRRAIINLEDEDGKYTVTRVRLRDVAFALKDTEAKFDIGFDAELNSIIITTGTAYDQLELDKNAINLKDANIVPSKHKVLVDGKELGLSAYNINGETYTSITQLRKALGNKFYIRKTANEGETLISFVKNDMEEFTKKAFDEKIKEKKMTLVFTGAPWCPWTIFNLNGLIPFQEYIDKNNLDVQIIAMVHDHQDGYKADILNDYQRTSPNPEKELKDYPFYTFGMNSDGWDYISEIAGQRLMYLPSIFFMNDEGKLVKYIQGGDSEEEEEEEEEDEGEPVPYNYIEIYEEIILGLKEIE